MKPIMIALMAVMLTAAAVIGAQADDLNDFYSAYLSAKTCKCTDKSCFLDSRSPCLREYAEINLKKAAFLKEHKGELIEKMIAADVGTKPCKIEYFLISAFGDYQRRQKLNASN